MPYYRQLVLPEELEPLSDPHALEGDIWRRLLLLQLRAGRQVALYVGDAADGLFGRLGHLGGGLVLDVPVVVMVLRLVLVVERLEREATMRHLASSPTLAYVWIVLAHRLVAKHLKLGIHSLQLGLKNGVKSVKKTTTKTRKPSFRSNLSRDVECG